MVQIYTVVVAGLGVVIMGWLAWGGLGRGVVSGYSSFFLFFLSFCFLVFCVLLLLLLFLGGLAPYYTINPLTLDMKAECSVSPEE